MPRLLTDAGTLWFLRQVTPQGRGELNFILQQFEHAASQHAFGRTYTLNGCYLPGELKVQKIRMELEKRNADGDFIILSTIDFGRGILWRRGSLRVANVTLPQSIKTAVKGKRIREVVEGMPVPDFTIRNIVEDKSATGSKLRIMCRESEKVEISL